MTDLCKLSDTELDQALVHLAGVEYQSHVMMVAHLIEVRRRRLHLALGYSSLFDYCVQRLKLPEGAVYLRTQVAKAAARYPLVLQKLEERRLSLTVLGKLCPLLKEANYETVLTACEGMTKADVEAYIVTIASKAEAKPSIRRKRRKLALSPREEQIAVTAPPKESDFSLTRQHVKLDRATTERFNISFSASEDFKQNLERLAAVMGVHDLKGGLEELLAEAVDIALEKKDPLRKKLRLEKKKAQLPKPQEETKKTQLPKLQEETKKSQPPKPQVGKKKASLPKLQAEKKKAPPPKSQEEAAQPKTRHVPSAIRREVFQRAGHRCEFLGRDGRRCEETVGLELDHKHPFARRGSHSLENCQILCRAHNAYKAEQDFGRGFMAQAIKLRQHQQSMVSQDFGWGFMAQAIKLNQHQQNVVSQYFGRGFHSSTETTPTKHGLARF